MSSDAVETLGTRNWCSYCEDSVDRNGVLYCNGKKGVFKGLPVKGVICTPCMREKDGVSNEKSND
ncbi:hypothetical protein lbkm_0664 [Lachnospiraceae bacterium KM106-2]|nr:hypothetical protein lbkm_0664 [Lachnospiraceae bacterium KM106-2]